MSEHYFKVPEGSEIGRAQTAYEQIKKRNDELYHELFCRISEDWGIESTKYSPMSKTFWIVPTDADNKRFSKDFKMMDDNYPLRIFKQTSKIAKDWARGVAALDIKSANKPLHPMVLRRVSGRFTWLVFRETPDAGDYYVRCVRDFDCTDDELGAPDCFIPIKGSEFYAVKEKLGE